MKNTLLLLSLGLSIIGFSQKSTYSLSILQDGEKIKVKKREASISKTPFVIQYKFKEGPQTWGLVAGSNEATEDAYISDGMFLEDFLYNSGFGGADDFFNKDKSIRAWDGEIQTTITFKDDKRHSFDSIYKKGKWIYGIRTVEKLSTKNDNLLVEDWYADFLYIATAKSVQLGEDVEFTEGIGIKLNFNENKNYSPLIVKGNLYEEEGEAEHQEGCEGCGNLGFYEFQGNGKTVEYLRSGFDIINSGTYTQKGNQVIIIKDEIEFTVSPDGTTMTHNQYGTLYKLTPKK